jgi:phenylacetate-CoA ligase
MLQQLYSALPIPLQHACATAQGAKYYRWRYGGVFQRHLEMLKRTEYLPAEQLHQMQTTEIARLRRFVAMHVPHYRKHGATVFTTKDQIRERPEDFIADTVPRRALIPWHTSGTTGKPLTVYYSREAMQKMWAFVELYRNTARVAKDERRGQFTGKMIVPACQSESAKTFWRRDLANHALLLSTVHLLPGNLPFYAAAFDASVRYICPAIRRRCTCWRITTGNRAVPRRSSRPRSLPRKLCSITSGASLKKLLRRASSISMARRRCRASGTNVQPAACMRIRWPV